jgi:hypothetical protein
MIATHNIEAISFKQDEICLRIDGAVVKLPLAKL